MTVTVWLNIAAWWWPFSTNEWVPLYLLPPTNEAWGKVIFLHLFVILFTGGGLPQCMVGYHPHRSRHPPLQTPPPGSRHQPLEADTCPQEQTHPLGAGTPHSRVCWEILSTSGQYSSYWNAILSVCKMSCMVILALTCQPPPPLV